MAQAQNPTAQNQEIVAVISSSLFMVEAYLLSLLGLFSYPTRRGKKG